MPAIIYRNQAGERVPSFSSVKSQWGISTQPLMYWAWGKGEKGIPLYEKEEADVGTCGHAMVEADAKGIEFDRGQYPMNILEQADVCFKNWQRWREQQSFEVVASELSLVSEKHQFGGTPDIIAMINGKLSILDLKTGKNTYPDHIIQIIAYERLWNENFADNPINGGYHIIRTGKEIASFIHSWYGEFPGAWQAFLHLRELYDLHKKIKKLM